MNTNTLYAPVVIPTLCRYEHFKRCLESLERCIGADKTDVYVGLDYPPSEKYRDGWERINSYLIEKENNNGFNHLFVRRRDHNCGVGGIGSNGALLLAEVKKVSDCYIFSEDDNEFGPCFLSYVNWGLDTYRYDERIIAICGYNEVCIEGTDYNVFAYPLFSAWGYGMWFEKRSKFIRYKDFTALEAQTKKFKFSLLWKAEFMHAYHVLRMLHRREFYGDSIIGCLPENERYCLFPVKSLVRNHGWDGSGLHGSRSRNDVQEARRRPIDMNLEFEPIIGDHLCRPELRCIYNQHYGRGEKIWKVLFRKSAFVLWKLTGINIC